MAYLFIIVGFVLLTFCAEILVRGSVAMAERWGVSPLVVGLTVVAFGTSAPELMVSLTAAFAGAPSITVGNIVGSNIANVILILGITGMIWPIPCANPKQFMKDSLILLLISSIFAGVVLMGTVVFWHGIMMVSMLVTFLIYSYMREKGQAAEAPHLQEIEGHEQLQHKSWLMIIGAIIVGLGGVVYGAELLVQGAVTIAREFGVSEEVIGLTMVAFGTSLPELATSMAAAFRKHTELALGNIIGSCMFNILGIMGITSMIIPVVVPQQIIGFDVWIMVLSAALLIPFILGNGRLSRGEAAVLFVMYLVYIGVQFYGVAEFLPWDLT